MLKADGQVRHILTAAAFQREIRGRLGVATGLELDDDAWWMTI